MNVLFVTNTLHRGGAEAHLLQLARGLRAHGVECEVAFLRSEVGGGSLDLRQAFEEDGIRTHYLECERSYDIRAGVRLKRLLDTRTWDVLHSHLPRADGAAVVCKLLKPAQVWISTLHHPYDNAYSGARLIPLMAPMWRRADGVIAVSAPVRQWAIDRLGVAPARVQTIVHGVDLEPGAAEMDPVQPGAGRRHRIGTIGRYEPRKGHETLIRAMVPILRRFPDAQLKIAGHDPWRHGEVLKRMIAELNLTDHVELIGFISDKEAFFSGIDVFAFASRSEGFGIVVLEAMAAGKPPVVSDIPPLNGIICPGESGMVATLDDPGAFANALVAMFEDDERLRRMGHAARRRVSKEFSTTQMVERTIECYRDVLERAARERHAAVVR